MFNTYLALPNSSFANANGVWLARKTFNNTLGPGGRFLSDLLDPYIYIKISSRYVLTSTGMRLSLVNEAVGLGSEDVALALPWEESIGAARLATCCSLTASSPLLTSPSALVKFIGSSSEARTWNCMLTPRV